MGLHGIPDRHVAESLRPALRRPSLRAFMASAASLVLILALGCGGDADAAPGAGETGGEDAATALESRPRLPAPSTPGGPSAGPATQSVDESRSTAIVRAANRVSPAVVSVNTIRTQTSRPRSLFDSFFFGPGRTQRIPGLGSGFIYDASGLIITNEHVVRGADRIMVSLPDGREYEAELLGSDEITDIAVLRIDGDDLPVAPVGTSDGLLIGEWTVAIGNPFGFLLSSAQPTVTAGVVSALNRHIVQQESGQRGVYVGMIQTDASINPGNSGGPLVNALGEVVGVNASILSRTGESAGLGFAIPIDRAVRVAFDLVRFGDVRRAWTGMEVEPEEADAWGRTRGVRVSRVAPGSPADRAGIGVGDRLVAGDGRPLANPFDYESLLLDHRADDSIQLEIDGRRGVIELMAETLPTSRAERIRVLEDLELVTLTPAVRSERRVQSEQGALVVEVSEALSRQIGLAEGDVILQINSAAVSSAEDAARLFRSVAGTGTVRIYFERNGGVSVRTFYWGR